MITSQDGYVHLIQYLTEKLEIFEHPGASAAGFSVGEVIETKLADAVMRICQQHDPMSSDTRFLLVRESDAIVYDLQEVLSSCWDSAASHEQVEFIDEYIGLIKNLFDTALSSGVLEG